MEDKIILSICIPTLNGRETLRVLLDDLMKQYNQQIEIVVCDNGDDGTAELVKNYPVKYKNNGSNLGFDRNLLNTLALAGGKYCWTVNNNVKIKPNAIACLLQELASDCDAYLISENEKAEQKNYDGSGLLDNCGLLGGKLARVILKRDKVPSGEKYIGNLWIHYSLMLEMVAHGRVGVLKELTIPDNIPGSRWASKDGMGFIAFVNLKKIVSNCRNFGYEPKVIDKIERQMAFDSPKQLVSAKIHGLKVNLENYSLLKEFPEYFPVLSLIFFTPAFVFKILKALKNKTRSWPPVKVVFKGLATSIPGAYKAFCKGSGGTNSARYCYSIWLRHLVLAAQNGLEQIPENVAELGPGDSLGICLAALLSGCNTAAALDVVRHANAEMNLKIFDELVSLFNARAPIPDDQEFPNIFPKLADYDFPRNILTEEILSHSLAADRIEAIREEINNDDISGQSIIKYYVPWNKQEIIKPERLDFIFSQFVLEHVNDLAQTYGAMYAWLKPGGLMSNAIDFQCHGTARKWNGHWAYSDKLWKLIVGGRPFLLNRDPLAAHLNIINSLDLKIINSIKYQVNTGAARSELAEKYKNISNDDLQTAYAYILAKK